MCVQYNQHQHASICKPAEAKNRFSPLKTRRSHCGNGVRVNPCLQICAGSYYPYMPVMAILLGLSGMALPEGIMMNGLQTLRCYLACPRTTFHACMLARFPSWGARSAVAQELAGQVERHQDLHAIVAERRAQRRRARRGLQAAHMCCAILKPYTKRMCITPHCIAPAAFALQLHLQPGLMQPGHQPSGFKTMPKLHYSLTLYMLD